MAGQKWHPADRRRARRVIDKPVYRAAIRGERVIIAALATIAARAAGEDVARTVILLVVLMALVEIADRYVFQPGDGLLFQQLADSKDPGRGVQRAHTAGSGAPGARRARARAGPNKKADHKADPRKR